MASSREIKLKSPIKKFLTKLFNYISCNINLFIFKIDKAIENFQLNVAIAQFYEVYRFLNEALKLEVSDKILKDTLVKIMKLMLPFTPHLANECLSTLNCKQVNLWPEINVKAISSLKISMAVQINGKTRDIISVNKDLKENDIDKIIRASSKAQKYIQDKKIIKTIFIKNKILNYIINILTF